MMSTSEDTILKVFTEVTEKDDVIERVKKIRDFAFVHFKSREDAVLAQNKLNGMCFLILIALFFCISITF